VAARARGAPSMRPLTVLGDLRTQVARLGPEAPALAPHLHRRAARAQGGHTGMSHGQEQVWTRAATPSPASPPASVRHTRHEWEALRLLSQTNSILCGSRASRQRPARGPARASLCPGHQQAPAPLGASAGPLGASAGPLGASPAPLGASAGPACGRAPPQNPSKRAPAGPPARRAAHAGHRWAQHAGQWTE